MQFRNTLRNILIAGLSLSSPALFAGIQLNSTPVAKPVFVLLGPGYSFSQNADISVQSVWDPAIQGYNATLGNSMLYTAGMGYRFTPLFDVDVEITRRPSYSYSKFQTPVAGATSPGPIGINTRKFDFDNTTGMVNLILNGAGANIFANISPQTILQPFVGIGIGISYNTVSDFHSVLSTTPVAGSSNVASIMNPQTVTAFAWQAIVGLQLVHAQTWGIDLGYRYLDGGRFESNNYLTSVPSGFTQPITTAPWTGKFVANEVFLNLRYFLG